jgi:hypothetical protein
MVRSVVANLLLVSGGVAVVTGAWLIHPPTACILVGLLLAVAGIALAGTGGRHAG